jgi:hypothetical protein
VRNSESDKLPAMSVPSHTANVRRKLIAFPAKILQALELLALDSGRSVQSLADEAFLDLLRKYHRPTSLKEALRESRRRLPANDDVPPERHGT